MSLQYIQQVDEDEDTELTRMEIIFSQMHSRGRTWPRVIGVVEIIVGFMLTVLGTFEVFILPMVESKDGEDLIIFDKINCYGAGMLAGFVMMLTGSTALRATMSKRDSTVVRFFNLTILSLLAYSALTLLLIVAYAKGWTSPDKYKPDSKMNSVHMFVTIVSVLGLLFALTSFIQYFDVICCGDVPLWSQWLQCLCPCIYNKVQRRLSFDSSLREEFNILNSPI